MMELEDKLVITCPNCEQGLEISLVLQLEKGD